MDEKHSNDMAGFRKLIPYVVVGWAMTLTLWAAYDLATSGNPFSLDDWRAEEVLIRTELRGINAEIGRLDGRINELPPPATRLVVNRHEVELAELLGRIPLFLSGDTMP